MKKSKNSEAYNIVDLLIESCTLSKEDQEEFMRKLWDVKEVKNYGI